MRSLCICCGHENGFSNYGIDGIVVEYEFSSRWRLLVYSDSNKSLYTG